MNNKGVSLIEFLVATLILAILLGLASLNFDRSIQQTRVRSTSSSLVDSLNMARSTAVSKNQRVVIRPQADWSAGWQIFLDNNSDGMLSIGDTILKQFNPPAQVSIKPAMTVNSYISYVGSGTSQTISGAFFSGTLRVCPKDGVGDGIAIKIRLGGRIRTETIPTPGCAGS